MMGRGAGVFAGRFLLGFSPLVLAGCVICPSSDMEILAGSQEVKPAEVVQLRARYGDWESGPERCGGHWHVNLVEGGTTELGTINDCGRYQAPAVAFPDGLVRLEIEATKHDYEGCADCCPYAYIALHPRP